MEDQARPATTATAAAHFWHLGATYERVVELVQPETPEELIVFVLNNNLLVDDDYLAVFTGLPNPMTAVYRLVDQGLLRLDENRRIMFNAEPINMALHANVITGPAVTPTTSAVTDHRVRNKCYHEQVEHSRR